MKATKATIYALLFLLTFSSVAFADEAGPEPSSWVPRRPASTPYQPPAQTEPVVSRPFTVYQAKAEPLPPPPPRRFAPTPAPIQDFDFFTVFADFLFWNEIEDGLAYTVSCPNGGSIASGCTTRYLIPKWEGGFRIGGAYTWSPDMWDLKSDWTWHKNYANAADASGVEWPTWTHPDNEGVATTATAFWNIEFNSVDLELGKTFKPGQSFTLRPHSGVKGAIIDQDITANYQHNTTPLNRSVTMSNDFGGIGVRSGFDLAWDLGSGFSILGKLSASVLWGQFTVHYLTRSDATGIANVSDKFQSTKAVIEGAVGLNYHTTFLGDDYPLDFYCKYEDQEWFAQNQLMRFMGASTNDGNFIHEKGDLGVNGVTFGMAFSF